MLTFFIFILLIINLFLTYKLYYNYSTILQLLLGKSFDNTKIEDLELYKDFFDIEKK